MSYIKREDAIMAVTRAKLPDTTPDGVPIANGKRSVTDCVRRIKAIPSADVVERKHGKWIPHIEEDYIGAGQYGYIELLKCSECGTLVPNKRNFCHHCGAEMEVDG